MTEGPPSRAWVLCDSGGGQPHRCSWRGSQDQGWGPRASLLHAVLRTRPRSMFIVHGAQGPALRGSISPTPCLAGAVGNVERALCPLLLPETTAPGDVQPRSRWGPPCGQEMTRRGCGAVPFWTTVCCRVRPTSATCSGHFVCFQVSDNP